MNASLIMTLLATFTVGGAVGGSVVHLVATAQVTCTAPAEAQAAGDGMRKLLESKPIPTTGYRSY